MNKCDFCTFYNPQSHSCFYDFYSNRESHCELAIRRLTYALSIMGTGKVELFKDADSGE